MLYIGIDLGTSAVKLLLVDEKGNILNTVSEEYPISFPKPGWSEQNPEDWLKAVEKGIIELTKDADKSKISAIGAGGQMHGLVILDENDRVLRPAIRWNDGRTQEETEYLNTVIGTQKLTEYTGNIAFAGFTAPKILWLKKHEPEIFAKIKKIMLPKDYINYMLTGVHCTDYSDASGMLLLDVKNKKWSNEMIDICGISIEQLPKLYESYEVVGTLTRSYSEKFGFPNTVKVSAGAGDNAAAAIGTGIVGNLACNISLGTSGTIFISNDKFMVDSQNSLHSFAHADGGWHLMGCMLSAASCNKWWLEDILDTKEYSAEQKAITDDMLGNNRVYFMPYLMGERSPHNDPNARGCFIGLSMDSKRSDMTQAILEGVAFAIRDSFEVAKKLGIKIERSMICGGGAKSPLWKKIMANVLNIELTIPETEQGPGLGGAILAAVSDGTYSSVEDAVSKLIRVTDTVKPDPKISERYEAQYQKFKTLYPTLKPVFRNLVL